MPNPLLGVIDGKLIVSNVAREGGDFSHECLRLYARGTSITAVKRKITTRMTLST